MFKAFLFSHHFQCLSLCQRIQPIQQKQTMLDQQVIKIRQVYNKITIFTISFRHSQMGNIWSTTYSPETRKNGDIIQDNQLPIDLNHRKIDVKTPQIGLYSSKSINIKGGSNDHNYNSFLTQQGNLVWAGATNLAFNDFKNHFLKSSSLCFKRSDKFANSTLNALNNANFTKKHIQQNAIYIKSGLGNEIIRTINRQVKQKFPFKTTSELKQDSNDDDFISYAYLIKALTYEHQFQRQPGMIWFGQSRPGHDQQVTPYMVECFAAISRECLDQIKIINYTDRDNFFVGFKSKQVRPIPADELKAVNQPVQQASWFSWIRNYLPWFYSASKLEQGFNNRNNPDVIYIIGSSNQAETVSAIIQKVMEAQNQSLIEMRQSNPKLVEFMMPVIDLDIVHEYNQFKGLSIKNSQLYGKSFKLIENIKLRMDEKGVVLQNDAFIGKDQCAIQGNIQINVNRPFWLVLTEQGNHPYFVAKINWLPKKQMNQDEYRY